MNAPYREPGTAPSEEVVLNHDYAADVRRDRDPKGYVKSGAFFLCFLIGGFGLLTFLLGGSILNWLAMVAIGTAFLGLIVVPIAVIALRSNDERMHVADLLDDSDERGRK